MSDQIKLIDRLGYYDEPGQKKPKVDPPVDLPCPYCDKPMHHFDVRTFGFMNMKHQQRSYFYRTHRTCDEAAGKEKSGELFEKMTLASEAMNDN